MPTRTPQPSAQMVWSHETREGEDEPHRRSHPINTRTEREGIAREGRDPVRTPLGEREHVVRDEESHARFVSDQTVVPPGRPTPKRLKTATTAAQQQQQHKQQQIAPVPAPVPVRPARDLGAPVRVSGGGAQSPGDTSHGSAPKKTQNGHELPFVIMLVVGVILLVGAGYLFASALKKSSSEWVSDGGLEKRVVPGKGATLTSFRVNPDTPAAAPPAAPSSLSGGKSSLGRSSNPFLRPI